MFRSCSCQLICCFITNNTLMTWHPYQLNSVMSGQLYEGFMCLRKVGFIEEKYGWKSKLLN
jgi:hypothetical protein